MKGFFFDKFLCPRKGKAAALQALELTFDDIVNVPVADASSVSDWNTWFDLPTNGTPFTSVTVVGNVVKLYGGGFMILKNSLFRFNTHIISIEDKSNIVEAAYTYAFDGATSLTSINLPVLNYMESYFARNTSSLQNVNLPILETLGSNAFRSSGISSISLPKVTSAGIYPFYLATNLDDPYLPLLETVSSHMFDGCSSLTTIHLPSATNITTQSFINCNNLIVIDFPSCILLGDSVMGLDVFGLGLTGKTITMTIPAALMTADEGSPDGDIQYLQANNTVTIIQV